MPPPRSTARIVDLARLSSVVRPACRCPELSVTYGTLGPSWVQKREDDSVGIRNRERRKAKHRARGQHRHGGERVAGARPARPAPARVSPIELVGVLLDDAVRACRQSDEEAMARAVRLLADERDDPAILDLVDHAVFAALQREASLTWRRGWQPADLARLMVRRLGSAHERLAVDAMAALMRAHPSTTVDRRWDDQLRSLDAVVWWDRDEEYLRRWAERHAVEREPVITCAVEVLALFGRLPTIPILCPLPGTARREAPVDGAAVEPRILEKVRALLAKAESTEFPEEAEALTAKAQEFMARHSIDAALLAAATARRDEPGGARVGIDPPYEAAKALLLQKVAEANRCRVVWSEELCFATVVGFDADLNAVELLFMSLHVQATAAVVRAGSRWTADGRSRTRAFRKSFLTAFAIRIGDRLRGATEEATRKADEATRRADDASLPAGDAGPSTLLPVLAARDESVRDKFELLFPGVRFASFGVMDREGWASGTAAADQAVLHTAAGYVAAG